MSKAFSFFLRLFLCFAAARFLLQAIGVEGRDWLVGLTVLFLANVYGFSYLVFRDRKVFKAESQSDPPPGPAAAAPEGAEPPVSPPPPDAGPPEESRRRSLAIPKD